MQIGYVISLSVFSILPELLKAVASEVVVWPECSEGVFTDSDASKHTDKE